MKLLATKLLAKPTIPFALVGLLLVGTVSVIYYVQRTLSEIEEALPITMSKQERDIRVLVNDMGRLVQDIEFARSDPSDKKFSVILKQTHKVELLLEKIRETYRLNDVLGISAIHAKLNPAIFDIKTWLTNGLYDFDPTSDYTLKLAELRAKNAHQEAEILLLRVGTTAINVLTEQAQRIKAFRNIMIVTLMVLTVMTIGLVLLGFRLQKIVFALKDSEEQIRYRANYDSLTDLPNRPKFVEHLGEAITRGRRSPSKTALMFIDLDRFKTINDTLGHDYGDELIRQVGFRIRETIRDTDLVARLGGDEFTVLLTDLSDVIHASIIAKDIIAQLSLPFVLHGHEIYTGASIGITVCPEDGEDANTLLKNADMAMYEAKDQGRNTFRFFTSQMTERAKQFLDLDKDLRRAMAQDELLLNFQPIYDLASSELMGVEVLLRWQHPDRGLVMPDEFITVAEETGLIDEIGLWVLHQACAEAQPWLRYELHEKFYMSVNISIRQFKGGFRKKHLAAVFEETGFPSGHLVLEITESLLMDDDLRFRDTLNEFRDLGVRLAVDDFGTGYSALSYLREFPVDTLKIDRSFIQDIVENSNDRRLVEAIVVMAHGLDLVVVAEGVETAEQDILLRGLNCDMVQGYFYGTPVSAAEITDLLESSSLKAGGTNSAKIEAVR